jgi:hypothetical protein
MFRVKTAGSIFTQPLQSLLRTYDVAVVHHDGVFNEIFRMAKSRCPISLRPIVIDSSIRMQDVVIRMKMKIESAGESREREPNRIGGVKHWRIRRVYVEVDEGAAAPSDSR